MDKNEKLDLASVSRDVGKREPSDVRGRMSNGAGTVVGARPFLTRNTELSYDPEILLLIVHPRAMNT